ncbi:MAG: mandelate racemase/muconate lactonizing enzyme family protein [Rhizobiaceae bacterium]|nr:mandelate racemase/muconate lactonizing enzyme family protein [Rhizobiaceae bacterium]
MKIKDVSTFTVDNFRTNWVFVVVTLEDGTRGYGESTLIGTETAVAPIIELWGERLIGQSVLDVMAIQARLQRESYWLTGPVMSAALSALDIALWDAKARALDVPLYALLGGKVRDRVPVYANGWYVGAKTPAEFGEKARAIVDRGFRALKWDPFGAAYQTMSRPEINRAMEYVAAVRQVVGPDIDMMIEGHGRFNVNTAIEIARSLEEFKVSWFEEPIPPGRPFEMAEVRRAVNVPIAAGERCYSRFDVAALLQAKAVDVLQPDVVHIGGFSEMVLINGLVDSFSLPMVPHNPNGPVCHAASMHMAMAWGSMGSLEIMITDVPWRGDIADEACTFRDGCLEIEERPGLGLTLNPEEMKKYPYQAHALRHFSGKLTNIRPPDARAWYSVA